MRQLPGDAPPDARELPARAEGVMICAAWACDRLPHNFAQGDAR